MRRREFVGLFGGIAAAWPLAVRAQQGEQTRRIAVLMGSAEAALDPAYLTNFWRRLQELGWKRGSNTRAEVRWWSGGPDHMRSVITDLLATSPDVIMVFSNLALAVLKPMSGGVPIVFVGVGDPIGDGFVTNLARPGGNITGFAANDAPMGGKWLEVLMECSPHLSRVMTVLYPETPIHQAMWRSIEAAARRVGVEVEACGVHSANDIETAVSSFATKGNGGVIVLPHAVTWANEGLIIALTLRYRLPSIYATAGAVKAGGFVFYGIDYEDEFRRTAEYVARILAGEKPGDLPVQQPVKFKFVVNLKTGRGIGLEVPASVLARADEVIE